MEIDDLDINRFHWNINIKDLETYEGIQAYKVQANLFPSWPIMINSDQYPIFSLYGAAMCVKNGKRSRYELIPGVIGSVVHVHVHIQLWLRGIVSKSWGRGVCGWLWSSWSSQQGGLIQSCLSGKHSSWSWKCSVGWWWEAWDDRMRKQNLWER